MFNFLTNPIFTARTKSGNYHATLWQRTGLSTKDLVASTFHFQPAGFPTEQDAKKAVTQKAKEQNNGNR